MDHSSNAWLQNLKPVKVNQVKALLQKQKANIQTAYNQGQPLSHLAEELNKAFKHTFEDEQLKVPPQTKGGKQTTKLGKPTIRVKHLQDLLNITPKKRVKA